MSVTEAAGTAAKLQLTFACGLYDRMTWFRAAACARLPNMEPM